MGVYQMLQGYRERHKQFVCASSQTMKQCVLKRNVKKQIFSEEALQEIREIDIFFKIICCDYESELEQIFRDSSAYIGIAIHFTKVELVQGQQEEHEVFIHHFFEMKDLIEPKIELYISKCVWLLNQEEGVEVFFCVNPLKALYDNSRGYKVVNRKASNAFLSNCLFCDLDLNEQLSSLSNQELLSLLSRENEDLFELLHLTLVRSGNGLHLYIRFETINFTQEENLALWKNSMRLLLNLLAKYGSDSRAIDEVRLLRPINTTNKKKKYGAFGKKVELIYSKEYG